MFYLQYLFGTAMSTQILGYSGTRTKGRVLEYSFFLTFHKTTIFLLLCLLTITSRPSEKDVKSITCHHIAFNYMQEPLHIEINVYAYVSFRKKWNFVSYVSFKHTRY